MADQILLDNVLDLIGPTPILRLSRVAPSPGPSIFVKLDCLLPGGSSCDLALHSIVLQAEKDGRIREGSTLVVPTDGLAGIGAAIIAAAKGYSLIAVLPADMPEAVARHIQFLGGEVVRTPENERMQGAISRAQEIVSESPGTRHLINLYESAVNADVHRRITAAEIVRVIGKDVDAVVCGVGTGGTLAGISTALKKVNPKIKIYAVEPGESNVLSGGKAQNHPVHGIGAGFVPSILNQGTIDKVVSVPADAAAEGSRQLARKEGLLVGPAGGAVITATLQIAQEFGPDQDIVAILSGDGRYYLNAPIYFPELEAATVA